MNKKLSKETLIRWVNDFKQSLIDYPEIEQCWDTFAIIDDGKLIGVCATIHPLLINVEFRELIDFDIYINPNYCIPANFFIFDYVPLEWLTHPVLGGYNSYFSSTFRAYIVRLNDNGMSFNDIIALMENHIDNWNNNWTWILP